MVSGVTVYNLLKGLKSNKVLDFSLGPSLFGPPSASLCPRITKDQQPGIISPAVMFWIVGDTISEGARK